MNSAHPNVKLPRLIAICGHPGSGKSLVQSFLSTLYGYQAVDDGRPLRAFAMQNLGLTEEDVYTQEGKARKTDILGKTWQNRDILGTLGNKLEDMFGPWVMPFMSTLNLDSDKLYSFGSCRRDQGKFYQSLGGVVIEVRNPNAGPSPYEFDRYDPTIADVVIENDGQSRFKDPSRSREYLEKQVVDAVNQITELGL